MAFDSFWEFLRQRTRNAVLAGFQDALETVEHGDSAKAEHEAATKLRARIEAVTLPQLAQGVAQAGQGGDDPPKGTTTVEDAIEDRLDSHPEPQANGEHLPYRRKRGRPRKDQAQ